jgi:hypothetical protein
MNASVAGREAQEIANAFPEDMGMNDILGQIAASGGSPSLNGMIRNWAMKNMPDIAADLSGASPDSVPDILGDRYSEALWGYLKQRAQEYSGGGSRADQANRIGAFHSAMKGLGLNLTRNQAKRLMKQLLEGNAPAKTGSDRVTRAEAGLDHFGPFTIAPGSEAENKLKERNKGIVISRMNQSPGDYEVIDSSGKASTYDPGNQRQKDALSKGDLKWRRKGETGEGHDTWNPGAPDSRQDDRAEFKNNSRYSVGGVVEIRPAGGLEKFLQMPNQIQLTPNDKNANAGYGYAQKNNPSPGG